MKKLWVITALVTCYFFSSTAVLAQELGEFCWIQENTQCTLKLNATQHNDFFSFVGNKICPNGELSHVSGSGFISDNQINIGLKFISESTFPTEIPETQNINTSLLFDKINLSDLSFSSDLTYVPAICDP